MTCTGTVRYDSDEKDKIIIILKGGGGKNQKKKMMTSQNEGSDVRNPITPPGARQRPRPKKLNIFVSDGRKRLTASGEDFAGERGRTYVVVNLSVTVDVSLSNHLVDLFVGFTLHTARRLRWTVGNYRRINVVRENAQKKFFFFFLPAKSLFVFSQ